MSSQLRKAHGEDVLALLAPCLHRRFFAGTYIEKRDAERVGARIQSSFSNVTVEFYHHGSGRPHMKCIAHGLLHHAVLDYEIRDTGATISSASRLASNLRIKFFSIIFSNIRAYIS